MKREKERELDRRRRRLAKLHKLKAKLEDTKDAGTRKRLLEKLRNRSMRPDIYLKDL